MSAALVEAPELTGLDEFSLVHPHWSDEGESAFDYLDAVQWGEASWDFDLTQVVTHKATGLLFAADDSGCSCPSPFEDLRVRDLVPISRLKDLDDHTADKRESYDDPATTDAYAAMRSRVEAALAEQKAVAAA